MGEADSFLGRDGAMGEEAVEGRGWESEGDRRQTRETTAGFGRDLDRRAGTLGTAADAAEWGLDAVRDGDGGVKRVWGGRMRGSAGNSRLERTTTFDGSALFVLCLSTFLCRIFLVLCACLFGEM